MSLPRNSINAPCLTALNPLDPAVDATGKPTQRLWHSRGYLPHRDEANLVQAITFRLNDSLPREKLRQLEVELADLPESSRSLERRKVLEAFLDAGAGCCALGNPRMAEVMENALLHYDNERYRLIAWCVMPNHVHVLIQPSHPLGDILRSWKGYTGLWAMRHNAELNLRIPGKVFWMREYWDRYMRDEIHLRRTRDYIHQNPVIANLCETPQAWPWSSARFQPLGTPT